MNSVGPYLTVEYFSLLRKLIAAGMKESFDLFVLNLGSLYLRSEGSNILYIHQTRDAGSPSEWIVPYIWLCLTGEKDQLSNIINIDMTCSVSLLKIKYLYIFR